MTGNDRTDSEIQLHRDIGRLEGRVAGLESNVVEMKIMLAAVHDTMMQVRGSWRVMLMIGTAAAAVGALVASFIGIFRS